MADRRDHGESGGIGAYDEVALSTTWICCFRSFVRVLLNAFSESGCLVRPFSFFIRNASSTPTLYCTPPFSRLGRDMI